MSESFVLLSSDYSCKCYFAALLTTFMLNLSKHQNAEALVWFICVLHVFEVVSSVIYHCSV